MTVQSAPLQIFCSCAPEDIALFSQLHAHLRLLERQDLLSIWHSRLVTAGTNWAKAIDERITNASIILLLISSDFFASDYCYGIEMQTALQRHQAKEALVIPLLLRPIDWRAAPPSLAHLPALPTNGRPITAWDDRDAAFADIAAGIRQVIQERSQIAGRSRASTIVERRSNLSFRPNIFSRPAQNNRLQLLKRVEETWITNVLHGTLQSATLLALGLQTDPKAVANPWHLQVQETDGTSYFFPSGTRITDAYDILNGRLLILGPPGAGKTTLLLELAQDLLRRAIEDDTHPMPIVFNLSSWATRRKSIVEWLIDELNTKYQVPHSIGTAWTTDLQILPLLDGLDEVAPQYYEDCVKALNAYQEEHGLLPVVICSRTQEYFAQQRRLSVNHAVNIQPLTSQQIDDYFASGGDKFTAVRDMLHQDTSLRELVSNPLMLRVLTLAYQDASIADLQALSSSQERRQQIFKTYVEHMPNRREKKIEYTPQQVKSRLTWLAKQLMAHHQTEFYLERIQISWVPNKWARILVPTLFLGSIYGLLMALIFGVFNGFQFGSAIGFVSGTISGCFVAILYSAINSFLLVWSEREKPLQKSTARASLSNEIMQRACSLLENRLVYGLYHLNIGGQVSSEQKLTGQIY
jgi:DNA polymerase III delta prime subunit